MTALFPNGNRYTLFSALVALVAALLLGFTPIRAGATTAPDEAPAQSSPAASAAEIGQNVASEAAVVERLQTGLLSILSQDNPLKSEKGAAALRDLVSRTFDIDAMGTVAVGITTFRNWSPWQRKTFLEAFTRFMIATHASRFENAPAQTFNIDRIREAQRGRKIVAATYTREGHDPVAIDYLVQKTQSGWRILDVYLDGEVSLLALHRAEFASVLREKGYDGFIAAMNAKSAELESRAVN